MRSKHGTYTKVLDEEPKEKRDRNNSEYRRDDMRFTVMKTEIPYSSVALAIGLMLFGIASFVLAWLHITQEILGKEQAEIGFTFLGFLTFIPGFYHTRIAYYAWRGYRGFTWDKIPRY